MNYAPSEVAKLTRRQAEVAYHVGHGLSHKEAAEEMGISARTVDHTIQFVYRKLGIRSMTQLAIWAVRTGLADHREWIERLPSRGTGQWVRPFTAALLLLCTFACPAQTVTLRGLLLESPTLVGVEIGTFGVDPGLTFAGDALLVRRVEDAEWDGPGVACYEALFPTRDASDPPAGFLIAARPGTVLLLTWHDRDGERCRRLGYRIDPRDYDLDQVPTVLDFWAFERDWEAGADFNLDGETDVRDVLDYLNCWGAS